MAEEQGSGQPTETATTATETKVEVKEQGQATTITEPAKPVEAVKPEEIKYDPFKVPEGVNVAEDVLAEFTANAKALGLKQEGAQALIDKLAPKIAAAQKSALEAQLAETRKGWVETLKADKTLGGEKFEANLAVANKAFETFGDPELKELLDTSGLGDHPALVRWAFKVGSAISEDAVIVGRQGDNIAKSPEQILFDKT